MRTCGGVTGRIWGFRTCQFHCETERKRKILDEKFSEVDANLAQVASNDFPRLSSIYGFLSTLQRHFLEIQPSFVRDVHRSAPSVFRSIQIQRRNLIQRHFARMLGEGRRSGLIRGDIPVRLMIEILLGTLDSTINPEKLLALKITSEIALSSILEIFFNGAAKERIRLGTRFSRRWLR